MMLKSDIIADRMTSNLENRLSIVPRPDIEAFRKKGATALDMRLGCWFSILRSTRIAALDVAPHGTEVTHQNVSKMHFVKFGDSLVLHPRSFILGVTLEWIKLPSDLGGYVTSRSSWGRRGLIIATAVGIHPGFTGCLTLELSNVGDVPIHLYPGMQVCQFFVHEAHGDDSECDTGRFVGRRRPLLGSITKLQDPIFVKLAIYPACNAKKTSNVEDHQTSSSLFSYL